MPNAIVPIIAIAIPNEKKTCITKGPETFSLSPSFFTVKYVGWEVGWDDGCSVGWDIGCWDVGYCDGCPDGCEVGDSDIAFSEGVVVGGGDIGISVG